VVRLGALLLALAAAVAITAQATRQRIARNEAAQVMKVISTVLPRELYDNEPDGDRILALAPDLLGSSEPLPVYRARRNGEPAAAVITAFARQGFVGPIRLMVAIAADGKVLAVRVVAHEETPGLGDRIDAAKSDWIAVFRQRSLADPAPELWTVRRDGGEFDQLTGATVTSRAVVNAVRDAALYFQQHRTEIFELPAE
jgi:electron transport complex protein RnfG